MKQRLAFIFIIQTYNMPKHTQVITIEITPDLSFEALWNLYNYKIKRVESEKCFNKLKEADVIKLFLEVPKYNKYMTKKTHDKAHLSTFINKRMFEDDFSKV